MNFSTKLALGLFVVLALFGVSVNAVGNSATASHILVKTEAEAQDLIKQIEDGADFAELAQKHSSCPSGKKGGSLGTFKPGQMVKEFNDVVFTEEVGVVHGPVKTQFGYHLILISDRN